MAYDFLKKLCTVVGAIVIAIALVLFVVHQAMVYWDNLEHEREQQVCETLALDPTVQLPTYCTLKK